MEPNSICEIVDLLIANRTSFGIADDNLFVFATKGSNGRASGWHAMASVPSKVGVSMNVTANRDYISTVYAEAPPWSSGSMLDHRSLPSVLESRRRHS